MTRLVLSSVLACVIGLVSGTAWAEDLVLFATSSTAEAMSDLAEKFTAATHLTVAVELGSPGLLARRIDAGEMPHVIVFDGKSWLDRLAAKQTLAAGTRRPLFSNRLVLITHRDFPHALELVPDTPIRELLGDSKFAIADPALDPAGELSRAALQSLNILRLMEEKLQLAPDVRGALDLVDRGEVDAGIVYATDARLSHEIKLSGLFVRTMHPPILYEIAIGAAKDGPPARRLYAHLLSREAREIYAARGFVLE